MPARFQIQVHCEGWTQQSLRLLEHHLSRRTNGIWKGPGISTEPPARQSNHKRGNPSTWPPRRRDQCQRIIQQSNPHCPFVWLPQYPGTFHLAERQLFQYFQFEPVDQLHLLANHQYWNQFRPRAHWIGNQWPQGGHWFYQPICRRVEPDHDRRPAPVLSRWHVWWRLFQKHSICPEIPRFVWYKQFLHAQEHWRSFSYLKWQCWASHRNQRPHNLWIILLPKWWC